MKIFVLKFGKNLKKIVKTHKSNNKILIHDLKIAIKFAG